MFCKIVPLIFFNFKQKILNLFQSHLKTYKIDLKTFHDEILNDHKALKNEIENYREIPIIHKIDSGMIQRNYIQIKQDIEDIVNS